MAALEDAAPEGPISPTARLTYFAGWGLAEQTRWMLAAAGIEFAQVALASHAEFEALRSSGALLFNQLPLLEIDGLCLTQSQAMVRYVARRAGLDAAASPADAAQVDMLCEGVRDARGVVVGFAFAPDRAAFRADAPARLAKQMPCFEHALADGGFAIAGRELTAADVLIAELVEGAIPIVPAEFWAAYPKVVALHQRVVAVPSIRTYLDSDRRYPFPDGDVGVAYVANVNAVLGR